MNKKAQTEDVFADMIPSIILIVIGIFVLYYISSGYNEDLRKNEVLITRIVDREAFSLAGMMNHPVEMDGKKHKLIELIDEYSKTEKTLENMKYKTAIEGGAKQYLLQLDPRVATCFKITLTIPSSKKEISMVDMCELNMLKDVRKDQAIIPLSNGDYARIKIENGEPEI